MSKVIDLTSRFVKKEEIVFSCLSCGGQGFWIDEGGTVTCRTCKVRQKVDGDWIRDAVRIHNEDGGDTIIELDESDEDE